MKSSSKRSANEYVRLGLEIVTHVLRHEGSMSVGAVCTSHGLTRIEVSRALRPWLMQDVPGSPLIVEVETTGTRFPNYAELDPTDTVVVGKRSWIAPGHVLFLRQDELAALELGLNALHDAGEAFDQSAVVNALAKLRPLFDRDELAFATDEDLHLAEDEPTHVPRVLREAFRRHRVRVTTAGAAYAPIVGDPMRWETRDGATLVALVPPGDDLARWVPVDSITDVERLDIPIDPSSDAIAAATPHTNLGDDVIVTLEVGDEEAAIVKRYGLTPVSGTPGRYTKGFPASESAVRMVLRTAPHTSAVAPPEVRDAVIRRAAELLAAMSATDDSTGGQAINAAVRR